jgi:DNA-binding NarL/FixJ family response regulator
MAEESNTLDTTQRLLELFAEFQAKLKQLLPEFFPEAPAPIPPPKVSDKMRKVLKLLCHPAGYTLQEIADKMGWELCTLRTYLSRFEKRIGVKGKAAIVGWAVKMGLD